MEFFGMGSGEVLVVLLVALLVLGPNRIVDIGRALGRIVRTVRKASYDLTAQVTKELEEEKKPTTPSEKKL